LRRRFIRIWLALVFRRFVYAGSTGFSFFDVRADRVIGSFVTGFGFNGFGRN
jgi:hypothetical protein